MTTTRPDGHGLIRKREATGVGVAAVFSAVVSYLVLLIAARILSTADNAIFLAYWALLFGTFGVLTGLHPESAREAFAGEGAPSRRGPQRLVLVAICFAALLCLALVISGIVWAPSVLGASNAWLVGVVALAGVAFSGHLSTTGVLAGTARWRPLILVTAVEATIRLVCSAVAAIWLDTLAALAVASAVSSTAWLLLLGFREVRSTLRTKSDAPLGKQLGNFAHACAASAASAALVVGFPLLVRITSDSDEYLGAAGLLLAISITRAPLMVPLNAYQGVAIAHFMRHRHEGVRVLAPVAAVLLALTAVAALVAAWIGPALFGVLLGDRYEASGSVLAGLTLGAGLLGLLTLTGACCLAVGGHRLYALGWLAATAVAVLLLLLPLPLDNRTVLSLILAPVIGALIHAFGATKAAHLPPVE